MIYYQFNPQIVPATQKNFVEQLLNCNDFTHSVLFIGSSKGRGITWFLNTKAELTVNCVRRHYFRGGLFGKWVRDRYFFSSLPKTRAAKEFDLLTQMHQWGLPVPRPIAFKITRTLGCYQADILLEKIENTQDLSQFLQKQTLSAVQYQQIGALIRQLHRHQIHHSDLNIHNILLDEEGKFWLIDFDKCQLRAGDEWKAQNLERLLRSFRKEQRRLGIVFSEKNWADLKKGYTRE